MVANFARGLLNRGKRTEKIYGSAPSYSLRSSFGRIHGRYYKTHLQSHLQALLQINKNHVTHLQALRRSRSALRPYKDSFDSSTRFKGIASQNSTLSCAITTFPVSLLPFSLGDV